IRIVGRFSIQNIKEIEINAKTNEHSTIYIKGIISADIGMEQIKDKCFKERIALVELDEEGKEKDYAIFDGIILNAEVKEEGNFFEVEIWGISASYLFDIEKKSRSFQNVNMNYSDILKEVIGEHKYIFTAGEDRAIYKPLIQYNETDWGFAKRLASHFNKPIQSDIITGNPRIWFGVRLGNQPQKEYERLFDTNTYSVEISNKYYEVGKSLGLSKLYYILYKVKDGRNFHIGDKVLFQDKKLIICEKEVKFEKGELIFYYTLARENYLSVIEYYNTDFTGLSLLGEIIKTENETVYLKLDIDGKNGEYPYKWTPTSGSLMYCMPKINTKASLYFSSADERSGIATNSPRTNGGSDSKSEVTTKGFDNVQNRGMVTEHGKRMDLYPELMRFSATGEMDSETGEIIKPLELLFDDESGIITESNKSLSLIALNNIKIESNQSSTFQAPILLNILRVNKYMEQLVERIVPVGTYTMVTMLNEEKQQIEYSLVPNDTTLSFNNIIDSCSYVNIVYQARVYFTYELFDDAPVKGKFDWGKLALNVLGGIALAGVVAIGFIGIGLVSGVAVAGIVFAFTGTFSMATVCTLMIFPAVTAFLAGVRYTAIKAFDDIEDGNVSDFGEYAKYSIVGSGSQGIKTLIKYSLKTIKIPILGDFINNYLGEFAQYCIDHKVDVILNGEEEKEFMDLLSRFTFETIAEAGLEKMGFTAEDIEKVANKVYKAFTDPNYTIEDATKELYLEFEEEKISKKVKNSINFDII
ncbi:MAG: phage late control D family protein, partial [Eubacteriales bacterium]|nr:phage late control D family protein [Eubacteriales bacterium]